MRFYDGAKKTLPDVTDVILTDQARFDRYKEDRTEQGKTLVGQATVGFNNTTGTFMLGAILKQEPSGHEYLIEWYDDTQGIQDERHLFGAFHRYPEHREGARVLAINADLLTYEFAEIISISENQTTLTVHFLNPTTTTPR